jgi:hypothetical protein
MTKDITITNYTVVDVQTEELAKACYEKLQRVKDSIQDNFFDLCELLLEAQEGDYHQVYGYERFGDWIEQGTDLDLSARSAYYYLQIAKKSRELGFTREDLKGVKISNLKEIFALDPQEHGDDMKRLLAGAAEAPLNDIKQEVKKLRADSGQPAPEYMTLKLDPLVKEIVDEAIELARMNYGDTVNEDGEVVEASVSKCIELICVDYLADPNNRNQE